MFIALGDANELFRRPFLLRPFPTGDLRYFDTNAAREIEIVEFVGCAGLCKHRGGTEQCQDECEEVSIHAIYSNRGVNQGSFRLRMK